MTHMPSHTDLLVIGGGINGAGVACDAAGRGLSVVLCEQNDLASATSSASSKLIHGGLRYLEHYEFRLVRESLKERSALLTKAPHLVHPMRFVLPHHPTMRPAWMLALGLFFYDRLAKFDPRLPRSQRLDLNVDIEGEALNNSVETGFSYSDCWVDDARLVIANAQSAVHHGAHVFTHMQVVGAERQNGQWRVTLCDLAKEKTHVVLAKAIVNAAGPWTLDTLKTCGAKAQGKQLRLVKGSHMVVKKLYEGDHAYIVQNDDGRIVFVIPYHQNFSLIGTTEVIMESPPQIAGKRLDISPSEAAYLCETVNSYFNHKITPQDSVWSFAGVRPLFDDKSDSASKVTREYVLDLDVSGGAPLLSIFGGKLTTYRQLAEKVLQRLEPYFPHMGAPWTEHSLLPGGEFSDEVFEYPHIEDAVLQGLAHRHGDLMHSILKDVKTGADLGEDFGAGLTAREVDYMIDQEWAVTVDDVLWRRSKLGLVFTPVQQQALAAYLETHAFGI